MSAQMLKVFPLGIGTVLSLERVVWSMVVWRRQATNEYDPPPSPPLRALPPRHSRPLPMFVATHALPSFPLTPCPLYWSVRSRLSPAPFLTAPPPGSPRVPARRKLETRPFSVLSRTPILLRRCGRMRCRRSYRLRRWWLRGSCRMMIHRLSWSPITRRE